MSNQQDNEEKQRLWKIYGIIMGAMAGGTVVILGSQWAWGTIQNILRQQSIAQNANTQQTNTNAQQQIAQTIPPSKEIAISTSNPTPTAIASLPISEEFSEERAQALVKRYLDAKSSIFAPPFNRQLVDELTTGKLRKEVTEAISWMQANNGFYRYEFRSVGRVGKRMYYNGNSGAVAELRVIEKYVYYQNGNLDPTQGDYYDKVVRWAFLKENGAWKISDREITKK